MREGTSDEADTGPRFIGEIINQLCEARFQGEPRAMVLAVRTPVSQRRAFGRNVLPGSQLWLNDGSRMSRRCTRSRYQHGTQER